MYLYFRATVVPSSNKGSFYTRNVIIFCPQNSIWFDPYSICLLFHLSFFFQMAPKNEVVMEDRRRLPGHGQKKWPLLVRSLSDSAKYLTRNSSSTSALAPASSSHQQSPKSAVETKALTLSLSDSRLFSICTSIGSSNNR